MIKYNKLPSIKISFEGAKKDKSEILSVYVTQYMDQLGIVDVAGHGSELEIIFSNENYKNNFFSKIEDIMKSEQANNNTQAKQAHEQEEIQKNIEYFMGALYEMQESGVLKKDKPPVAHPPVKGIVLQGGGVKGLAYLGALEEMEKTGALGEAEFVCGSSAGAINALLIATGLSAHQIKQYCMDFDTRNLMDVRESALGEYQAGGLGSIIKGVIETSGAYGEAKTAKEFLRNILFHLTGDADVTFAELEEMRKINPSIKEFLCTATLLPEFGMGAGETRLFSHRTSPNVVVADAVLASMSLPGVWAPTTIRQKVYQPNYQIHFEEIGTYSDGGIHNNLPVDVANEYVSDKEYLMIPRNGVDSFTLDNPCVLSLSLCNANQLNEAICPVPEEVKGLAIRNNEQNITLFEIENVNKAKQALEEYQSLPIPSVDKSTSTRLERPVSPHRKAAPSNAIRLVNFLFAHNVENATEKNMLHNEGSILLYDNGISAAKLGLSTQDKNELIMIGSKTTKKYFLEKRNPTTEYSHPELYSFENLDQLHNDKLRNEKLDVLFKRLAEELEKYTQPDAQSRGYSWGTIQNNIKIQNLYWKINKIYNKLETKPHNFDFFVSKKLNEAFSQKMKKVDFHAKINDDLYKNLSDLSMIKRNLKALIKQQPFDEQEFFSRFTALGADTIVELTNKHHSLLFTAAMLNPKAFDIMLSIIEKSYMSLHQVPGIAVGLLGAPRMEYDKTKQAFKDLVNVAYKNKPLIFHCIDANQPKAIKSLLQHQANLNAAYDGKSIFQYAIEKGRIECFLTACKTKTNGRRLGNKFITKQYDAKDFGKFITYGFHDKRTLAHVLFSITDKSALKRSFEALMKPENDAIWAEFKKALYQPDANGITPLDLASVNLDEEVFLTLLSNISHEPNEIDAYERAINLSFNQ